MPDPVMTRFLALVQASGLLGTVPAVFRGPLLAAARRDPARTRRHLDQLAALWQAAQEDTTT